MTKEELLLTKSDEIRNWEESIIDAEHKLFDLQEQKAMIQFKVDIELGDRGDLKNEAQRKAYKAQRIIDLGVSQLNYKIFNAMKELATHKADFRLSKREYDILLGRRSDSKHS